MREGVRGSLFVLALFRWQEVHFTGEKIIKVTLLRREPMHFASIKTKKEKKCTTKL